MNCDQVRLKLKVLHTEIRHQQSVWWQSSHFIAAGSITNVNSCSNLVIIQVHLWLPDRVI